MRIFVSLLKYPQDFTNIFPPQEIYKILAPIRPLSKELLRENTKSVEPMIFCLKP